jgi:hypothetical protein
MKILVIFSVLVSLVLVSSNSVLAQPPGDVLYSSEVFEKFDVKLINDVGLVLPIIVAWFAIKVAYIMSGGKLEDVWKLIAAGMSVLAIVKVVDGLEALGILYVGGLRSVLEFVMILVFFVAFFLAYRSLVQAIRGPIPVESPKISVPGEGATEAEKKEASEEKKE